MSPSSYIMRDQLPLRTDGKTDRNALPLPESVRPNVPVRSIFEHPTVAGLAAHLETLVQNRETHADRHPHVKVGEV
jgi:hypothetical protein